jgi:putative phage-type endonuclease
MLTEQQIELRKTCLGSSDMSAVLGINPHRSAWEVWADKRGILPPDKGSDATEIGNYLEPAVLDYAESQLGKLHRGVFIPLPEYCLGANLDGIVDKSAIPVEAKTSGIRGPLYGEWGDDGTDHVPDCYIVQCHVQMMCAGADLCHLYALLGGMGFRHYTIRRVDGLCAKIADKARQFWTQCVVGGAEPADSKPDLEVLKRIRRRPDKVAVIHPSLKADYDEACAALKAAEKRKEETQAALLAADIEAEAFDWGDGKKWMTFFEQSRTTVDSKALAADHPSIWKDYAKTSTFRVLRTCNKP